MALANCSKCGKLFNKLTKNICNDCTNIEDEALRKTQQYLRKNPNASIAQVIIALEDEDVYVDRTMLEKWTNERRITLVIELKVDDKPRCSLCGREVKSGEYICKTCKFTKIPRMNEPEEKPPVDTDYPVESDGKKRGGIFLKRQA